jgi:hypothetical protein
VEWLRLHPPCDGSLNQFVEYRLERGDSDGSDVLEHCGLCLSPEGFLPGSRQKLVPLIGQTLHYECSDRLVKLGFYQPCILREQRVLINFFRAVTGNFNRMCAHAGRLFFNFNKDLAKQFYVACQIGPPPDMVRKIIRMERKRKQLRVGEAAVLSGKGNAFLLHS